MSINSSITSSDWLATATDKLNKANISSARLDAILILELVTKIPRIKIISNENITINTDQISKLDNYLNRRLNDEPHAYIRGFAEFYGRDFIVDNNVLVPRPESEAFINLVKDLEFNNAKTVDIGCGSGCLGITIALERPDFIVSLLDISNEAMTIAKLNAKKYKLSPIFYISNLLENIDEEFEIYIVNLPYVPNHMSNINNLSFEPKIALFSGVDGLDLYRKFWNQITNLKHKPEYILCESLLNQHSQMINFANTSGYSVVKSEGLIQEFILN